MLKATRYDPNSKQREPDWKTVTEGVKILCQLWGITSTGTHLDDLRHAARQYIGQPTTDAPKTIDVGPPPKDLRGVHAGGARRAEAGRGTLLATPARCDSNRLGHHHHTIAAPAPLDHDLSLNELELSSAPTWTGWTVPEGPGTRPKAPVPPPKAPVPLCPQAPCLCDVPEPGGGGHVRTHEGNGPAAPPAGHRRRPWNQGQGLGQDLPRSGYQGGMGGSRPRSCQEAAGERPARGLPAQSACAERGVRSEGPGIQELEGGGCQGTNRAIARCGGRGWRPTVKVAARRLRLLLLRAGLHRKPPVGSRRCSVLSVAGEPAFGRLSRLHGRVTGPGGRYDHTMTGRLGLLGHLGLGHLGLLGLGRHHG